MPTVATLRTNPGAETTSPALPAPAVDWAAELADVPGTVAYRAALRDGALLVPRGTCGETGHAWFYDPMAGWMHDDGYNVTVVPVTGDGSGVPADVEVLEWRHNSHRAVELAARCDRMAEREYLKLAGRAARRGETAAFRAAVEQLHTADPYALDGGLYARLVGADPTGDGEGEPEGDEDHLTGR